MNLVSAFDRVLWFIGLAGSAVWLGKSLRARRRVHAEEFGPHTSLLDDPTDYDDYRWYYAERFMWLLVFLLAAAAVTVGVGLPFP